MSALYWEMYCDQIRARGWSVGWVRLLQPGGIWIWQADAHKGDGKRYVAQAEELTVAFMELQRMTREAEA